MPRSAQVCDGSARALMAVQVCGGDGSARALMAVQVCVQVCECPGLPKSVMGLRVL